MTGRRMTGSIKVTTPRGLPAQPLRIQVPEWVSSAAVCSQVDPGLFWVDPGGTASAAKALCATCPLIGPCLEDALSRPEFGGVWGGTDPEDRRKLRARKGKAPAARCGTDRGRAA